MPRQYSIRDWCVVVVFVALGAVSIKSPSAFSPLLLGIGSFLLGRSIERRIGPDSTVNGFTYAWSAFVGMTFGAPLSLVIGHLIGLVFQIPLSFWLTILAGAGMGGCIGLRFPRIFAKLGPLLI